MHYACLCSQRAIFWRDSSWHQVRRKITKGIHNICIVAFLNLMFSLILLRLPCDMGALNRVFCKLRLHPIFSLALRWMFIGLPKYILSSYIT
jgi:hypothetical protein